MTALVALRIPTQPAPAHREVIPGRELFTASCGCVGTVLARHSGPFPYVDVLVTQPCVAGHPHRISPGVVEHFPLPSHRERHTT